MCCVDGTLYSIISIAFRIVCVTMLKQPWNACQMKFILSNFRYVNYNNNTQLIPKTLIYNISERNATLEAIMFFEPTIRFGPFQFSMVIQWNFPLLSFACKLNIDTGTGVKVAQKCYLTHTYPSQSYFPLSALHRQWKIYKMIIFHTFLQAHFNTRTEINRIACNREQAIKRILT